MTSMSHPVIIHHKNQTKKLEVRHGLGLQVLQPKCDWIELDCRKADCGICVVRVQQGAENLSAPTNAETDFLKAMHAQPNERLACQCRVFGPVELGIDDYS